MLLKQPEPRLDPRMKRTRQMLQKALMELMHEKTFQSITVQDIAERATVNRATFYDHFVDKFALLEYSVRDSFEEDLRHKLPDDAHLSLDGLRALIEMVCTFIQEGHRHCKPADAQILRLVETQTSGLLVEVLHGWLDEARRADAPGDAAVETTAHAVGWAIFGAVRHWEEDRHHQPAAVFAEELLPFIVAGLEHTYHIDGIADDFSEPARI
jgi:AcrR family transcriptional regulator